MAVKLLHNLFNISLALSPVIMLLLFASPLLGKRYGARLRCLVWLALAVRLLIPLNTPIKIAVALPQYEAWMTAPEFPQATDKKETDTLQPENLKPANASPVPFTAVWAAGAGLFLLYQAGAYMYTCRRLRRWSAEVTDENTLRRFEKAKAELSVTGSVGLFRSQRTASPLLAGFLRPRVVLPDKPLENVQLDFMLRHELTHLKRGDLWYKLLLLLANAVHWFNPLVWLLASQLSFDTELACDADVLAGSGRDERKAYGYTVLSFIEYGWRKDHDLLCLTPLTSKFLGGKKQLKKRFYNITDTTAKKRGLVFLFAIMLIAALAGSSVYAAAQENPAPPESKAALTEQSELDAARFNIVVKEFFVTPGTAATDKAAPEAVPEPAEGFIWPVKDEFRVVCKLNDYPGHTGIDILPKAAVSSTHETRAAAPVYAAKSGTVVLSKNNAYGYGKHIIIDHGDGYQTVYAHNSELLVEVGDAVEQGQMIAKTGATGNAYGEHLHFEIRKEDNILNPEELLPTLIADVK